TVPHALLVPAGRVRRRPAARLRRAQGRRQRGRPEPHQAAAARDRARAAPVGSADERLRPGRPAGAPGGRRVERPRVARGARRRGARKGSGVIRAVAILPIRLYQLLVSPFVAPNTCKYHPTCSEYAVLAIKKHGVVKGVGLAAFRLLRCNPWSRGGVDYP